MPLAPDTILPLQIRNDEAEAVCTALEKSALPLNRETALGKEGELLLHFMQYVRAKQIVLERELFPMPFIKEEEGCPHNSKSTSST